MDVAHHRSRTIAVAAAVLVVAIQGLAPSALAGQRGTVRPLTGIVKPVPPMPGNLKGKGNGGMNVGLLLPAVQAAREARTPPPPAGSSAPDDCMSCE
jgi:hypothetical protein